MIRVNIDRKPKRLIHSRANINVMSGADQELFSYSTLYYPGIQRLSCSLTLPISEPLDPRVLYLFVHSDSLSPIPTCSLFSRPWRWIRLTMSCFGRPALSRTLVSFGQRNLRCPAWLPSTRPFISKSRIWPSTT
jgi:hypothetical protein